MTNNKLTDKRATLREAAKNYQTALAWYQSNIDSPAALQTWDAATAEFMAAIGNRETDIIADLLGEIDELQERRKAGMDSEPVGWTDEQELRSVEKDGCGYLFKANPISPNADLRRVIKLYAAPQPAPDSEAQITLKRLAVIMHGSEVDLDLLTVTAQSLMEHCKALSSKPRIAPVAIYDRKSGDFSVAMQTMMEVIDERDDLQIPGDIVLFATRHRGNKS